MQYAARLPRIPSTRTLAIPVAALVLGAGVATGTYALIDNGGSAVEGSKVIVVETPAAGTADIPGKNEAVTAAAISPAATSGTAATDEAATAAAIASDTSDVSSTDEAATAAAISESSGVQLRGSTASDTGTSSTATQAEQIRTDPHGPAIVHNTN